MTSLNNKYTNNRSMNGLINIYADNIEATNSVVNDSLTVGGVDIIDIVNQVETNTINLTGITYDGSALPVPRTTIDNELYTNSNLVVGGTATVDNSFICNSFFEVSNKATFLNSIDVKGEMKLRDSADPTKFLRAYYSSGMNGFVFNNEVPASIMYFLVNDPYGNVKSVQFNYQNFFISIPMTVQTDFNMDGIMYFPNSSDPAALFYTVPTTDPSHGFWIMTRRNSYHFNIYNRDNSGADINTFRTHYSGVYSLVPFTCEGTSTFNGDAEFNAFVAMNSTLTLNSNLIANSTTITPLELSYLGGTIGNIQTQLNAKINATSNITFTGANTFTGTNTFNNNITLTGNMNVGVGGTTSITPSELACLLGTTSNIQSNMIMKAGVSSNNTFSGTNTFSNSVTFTGNVIANSLTITPTELSYIDGTTSNIQTQLNSKSGLSSNNTFSGTNTFPSITFNDASVQATAYTNTKNTKLDAIGTVVTATLTTATLTSGTFYSAGSITLTVGTWIINTNACFSVITGSTTVGQILACPSISSSSISGVSRLSINQLNSQNFGIGSQWVLTSSNIYTPTVTTNYFCLVQASFGTASRLQFASGNSRFEAYRIA